MKQENNKPIMSFWEFLKESYLLALIPVFLGRALLISGPIGFMDVKYEYSLGMFLQGITPLLIWFRFRQIMPSYEYKKVWGFVTVIKIIFLGLTIWYWARAIRDFLTLN